MWSLKQSSVPTKQALLVILQSAVNAVLGDDAPRLDVDARLDDADVDIDSLDLIEVAMELEATLGIEFAQDQFDSVETVDQLLDVVLARRPMVTLDREAHRDGLPRSE